MDISAFVCDTWTDQQRQLYERIKKGIQEGRTYQNCIAATLGYLDLGNQEEPFGPEEAFSYIESLSETTQAPEFGALAVWYSNPIQLMTINKPVITAVRHAAVVLGTKNDVLYTFDQMRGRLYISPVQETTIRVDEFSRERYRETYNGIITVAYHPFDAVCLSASLKTRSSIS